MLDQFKPDYSNFPFDLMTYEEIAQLMMESIQIGDTDFATACKEHLTHRKPASVEVYERSVAWIMD